MCGCVCMYGRVEWYKLLKLKEIHWKNKMQVGKKNNKKLKVFVNNSQ